MSSHDDAVRERFSENADRWPRRRCGGCPPSRRASSSSWSRGATSALDVGTGRPRSRSRWPAACAKSSASTSCRSCSRRGREYAADRSRTSSSSRATSTQLPFELGSFDLVCERAVLHHVPRPELVLAEMTRVTRPGGRLLVIDQLAPFDPLAAIELDRFERERDPSHTRLLSDGDLRALFEANDLVLIRSRFDTHDRELDPYLDLAGCEGDARERARSLAPGRPLPVETGWYLSPPLASGAVGLREREAKRPRARRHACATRARYQRGYVSSGRQRSIALTILSASSSGVLITSAGRTRSAARSSAEALGLDEPRIIGEHVDPAGASSADVARENASCACFDAEYGPDGRTRRAGDGDDVHDVRFGRRRLEAGQKRAQAPDSRRGSSSG